jgi:CBS domain-containing protein
MQRKIIPDVVQGQELLTLSESRTVREAARCMCDRRVGSVLVTRKDRLVGIFTERDVVSRVVAPGRDPDKTPLAQVMTQNPDTVVPRTTAIEALRRMQDGGFRHLPVVDQGRLVGIVSRRDFYGEEKAQLDDETTLWERV